MPRINQKDAFDPHNATDEEWATFEKSVRYVAQDPHLDVGKLFNIPERTTLGFSESTNMATDATSDILEQRAKEIKKWVKENIAKVIEMLIEGIQSLPEVNILKFCDWDFSKKEESSPSLSSRPHDDLSSRD